MRGLLLRLRAAITPQAALMLAAIALLVFMASARGTDGNSPLEASISRTLSHMEGAGHVEVTIRTRRVVQPSGAFSAESAQEIPAGAVAVAQGADDPMVAWALQEALCALLGLPASSVSIVTGGR